METNGHTPKKSAKLALENAKRELPLEPCFTDMLERTNQTSAKTKHAPTIKHAGRRTASAVGCRGLDVADNPMPNAGRPCLPSQVEVEFPTPVLLLLCSFDLAYACMHA